MKNNIIVGLGELLWDVFPSHKILGGAPANFAFHASQLGYQSIVISAIGDDILGEEVIKSLKEKHLNHSLEISKCPTGMVKVNLDDKGVPTYEICENVAWDNISYSDEMKNIAKSTVAVCFGSLAQRNDITRNTIEHFLNDINSECLKIFDINLRQNYFSAQIIENSIRRANILKLNDEEIVVINNLLNINKDSELEICKELIDRYKLKILILTKGTQGSIVITKNETSFIPTPIVKVKDTVGAGDSFTATFIVCFLKGKSIKEAHKMAVDVSAFVCTQSGAMPLLPESITNFFI